jgi:hypothetical protein
MLGRPRTARPRRIDVQVIRRTHVRYCVEAEEEHRETVERGHGFHRDKCPVYRSISSSIAITTEYDLVG